MEIEVSSGVVDAMLAEAAAAHPFEACGLLLGAGETVRAAVATANVHPEPAAHFEIDPRALIDAFRTERASGPQVLGYWHSHPCGTPEPSSTDRAHATGDGRVWAIVGQGRVGWWRDAPGGFEPLSSRVSGR